MSFIIPKNLNLVELIRKKGTITLFCRVKEKGRQKYIHKGRKSETLLKHVDSCHFLIHTIIEQQIRNEKSGNQFVNLSKQILEKYIPKPTCILCLSLLEALEVIYINAKYSHNLTNPAASFSKSYRLREAYSSGECREVEVTNRFEKKIVKVLSQKTKDLLASIHHSEYSFLRDKLLTVRYDADAAFEFLQSALNNESLTRKKYTIRCNTVRKVSEGIIDVSIGEQSNRFCSIVSMMARELRPFIEDESGNTLIQIDFSSSHTFHLVKQLKGYLYLQGGGQRPNEGTLLEETERLLELMLKYEGGLYAYIITRYKSEFGKDIGRDKAKNIWNKRFLHNMKPNEKITVWIKSLFPAITNYLSKISVSELSIRLHRSEAALVNNWIVRRIAREVPDALIYGIYDALLVNEVNFDEVYNIMLEEATVYFGFTPVVKEDRLQRPSKVLRMNTNVDSLKKAA